MGKTNRGCNWRRTTDAKSNLKLGMVRLSDPESGLKNH